MSRIILRQPDGQLSIFSTVTDTFLGTDVTPEEIAEAFAEEAYTETYERTLKEAQAIQIGRGRIRPWVTYDEAVALDAEHRSEVQT